MNKVLVTGANGMLGQDLCPILQEFGYKVIKTDIDTMDITDLNSVKNKIMEEKPDFIIHCAAYTNVDKAEDDLENAILINKIGTENVAKVCEFIRIAITGHKNSPDLFEIMTLLGEKEVQNRLSKFA